MLFENEAMNWDMIWGEPIGASKDIMMLLFGDWLFGGDSSTVLTYLISLAPFVSYMLLVVMLFLQINMTVLNTATTGRIPGKPATITALKALIPMLLLAPVVPAGNVSVSGATALYLDLVKVSSNIADVAGGTAMQELTRKRVDAGSSATGYKVISDLTNMAFCTNAISKYIPESESRVSGVYGYNGSSHGSLKASVVSEGDTKLVRVGQYGKCGTIRFQADSDTKMFQDDFINLAIKYEEKIFNNIVMNLDSYNYITTRNSVQYEAKDATSVELRNATNKASKLFLQYANDFQNEFSDIIVKNLEKEEKDGDMGLAVKKDAEGNIYTTISREAYNKYGWPYLGAYYTLMSKSVAGVQNVYKVSDDLTSFTMSAENGCELTDGGIWNSVKNWFSSGDSNKCYYIDEFGKAQLVIDDASSKVVGDKKNTAMAMSASCTSAKNCDPEAFVGNMTSMIASSFVDAGGVKEGRVASVSRGFLSNVLGVKEMGLSNDDEGNISPSPLQMTDAVTTISNVGHRVAYSALLATNATHFAKGIADGVGDSLLGQVGAGFFKGLVNSFMDYIQLILLIIQGTATSMAFFVPLVPSLLWTTGVLSYWITVVAGAFAINIAIVMMAKPEFEGTAGFGQEKTWNLLLATAMTPLLLIFGYIASMFFVNIGFILFNQLFWMAVNENIGSWDLLGLATILLAWFSTSVFIIHFIFKLIVQMAQMILEWAGGAFKAFGANIDNQGADKISDQANRLGTAGNAGKTAGMGVAQGLAGRIKMGGKKSE